MVVLLLFNDQESWTYKELQQTTSIPAAELKRALQGMLQGKGKRGRTGTVAVLLRSWWGCML